MELASLSSSRGPCSSSDFRRLLGRHLLVLFRGANVSRDSLCALVRELVFKLPVGYNALRALRRLNPDQYKEKWLSLELNDLRRNNRPEALAYHVIVPNVIRNHQAIGKFLSIAEDCFVAKVLSELMASYVGDSGAQKDIAVLEKCSFREFGMIMEAGLPGRFPPLLCANLNFHLFNLAQPTAIHLDGSETEISRSLGGKRNDNRRDFPRFYMFKKQLFAALRGCAWDEAKLIIEQYEELIPAIVRIQDRRLCKAILKVLRGKAPSARTDFNYLIRQVNELPRVHRMVWANERNGKVTGMTRVVLRKYLEVEEVVIEPALEASLQKRSKTPPRQFVLEAPSAVRKRFLSSDNPPIRPDLGASRMEKEKYLACGAFRILANILIESGRRCVCLLGIELRHFFFARGFSEFVVPFTKGHSEKNMSVPISPLWVSREFGHLQNFLSFVRCQTDLAPTTRLTEIAGLGRFEHSDSERGHSAVYQAIKRHFCEDENPATHVPRIHFVSWFFVRALVAHHPWLLEEEQILECCVDDPWFQPEALNRFRVIYPTESLSAIEVCRRIIGHGNGMMIATVYCRSLPILLKLWTNPKLQA